MTSENSVNDLIKPKKRFPYETSKTFETSKTSVTNLLKLQKKYLYLCGCICCDDAKVNSCTQKKHLKNDSLWQSENIRKNQENAIMAKKQKKTIIIQDVNHAETISNISKKRKRDGHHASSPNLDSFLPNNEDTDSFQLNNEKNISALFSTRTSCFRIPASTLDENNDGSKNNDGSENNDGNYFDEDNEDEYNMD
jgi:hypothetical protein